MARKKARKKAKKKTSKRAGKVIVSRAAYEKVIHLGAAHHSKLAELKRSARVLGGGRKKTRKKGRKKTSRRR